MQKNLKYWLALNSIPNLGPVTIKKLWDRFGSIEKVWGTDEKSILGIEGISKVAVAAFLEKRKNLDLQKELDRVLSGGIKVLTLEDEDYPVNLKNIYDPPPVLYVSGTLLPGDEKSLAIVGTRKASIYGMEIAKKLAFELASLGITIVSGMALGIDTAAHQGALEAKGRTIAVLGCGLDIVYPPQNKSLAAAIPGHGAVVSEFPLGTGTEKGNFPRRNRIIAGWSLGTIVVEGHYDSGAMITAKFALDQGREVFAIPGNIEMEQSKGPHWLIKQGAKLVESVEDILEELNLKIMSNSIPSLSRDEGRDYSDLSEEEKRVIAVLSIEPRHVDALAAASGFSISKLTGLLMVLEIKKLVRRLPGGLYQLAGTAGLG